MVTIKDIAREANVSFTAVSIVLGKRTTPGRVGEETRERINAVAARMGYSRNGLATNMRRGRTNLIAFVSNNISLEYTSRVLDGAAEAIDKNHYFLKLFTAEHPDTFRKSLERLLEQRPAGIILRGINPARMEVLADRAETRGIPLAFVENYHQESGVVNVFSDDILGMESVVEHLHGLGHRRIAHVSNGLDLGYGARRYQGFLQGMEKYGLVFDESLLFSGYYEVRPHDFVAFVDRIASGRLATAICVATDFEALTVMSILQSRGVKVPEEISVTGFADMGFCKNCYPALTTVRQPFEEMGAAAAAELIKVIRGQPFQARVEVPTELVVRDSSGAVGNATTAGRK
ncbi:MAG: LacI family DNA-binding transcriptional regulator [Verrucomicrobia bacterium]|nr:LacI family DNA-binding transcriptional regulator [Verrucomicrobiota bacterium]